MVTRDEPGALRHSVLPLSVRHLLPGLLAVALAVRLVEPLDDIDAYWHIAAGDHLRENWQFVLDDPFGAGADRPWILNQWLPELLMSGAHSLAGLPGVVWFGSLGSVAFLLCLWAACRRRAGLLVATLVLATAMLAASPSLAARPQLVTFCLVAVTADAWLRTADDGRLRWWLVPMGWVWACSHGMWFLGPAIGACVVLGLALEGAQPWSRLVRLALVPLGCVAVAAVTPVGPGLLGSPFQVGSIAGYITEWQPPAANSLPVLACLALCLIVVVRLVRGGARHVWVQGLLVLVGFAFAVTYQRTSVICAAVVAPLGAAALSDLTLLARERVTRREVWTLVVVSVLGLLVAAGSARATAREPGIGPGALSPQLSALPAGTVVCNEWSVGGWLIWKHPDLRVTVDSRAEIYSVAHIEVYAAFLDGSAGWDDYVTSNGCDVALVKAGSAPDVGLVSQLGWTRVMGGDGYVLLRSPPA